MNSPYSDPTTNFGFQKVPADKKNALVRDVFDSVAPNYDLMNDLMSFGIHRLWKSSLLDWLNPHPKKVLLDVAASDAIEWVCGDAEALPFPDRSIDVYTIAFGLRNVTSIQNALYEAKRVLRPGGRFLCLEFSTPAIAFINPIYDAYSFKILPEIGHFVANDRDAYKYLVESIRKFPDQINLEQQINSAGLEKSSYRNLSGGIAAIHSAWRL
jgi:demethylmenaquinone methyltransferase/2-methoxy-6-polyprenyl-1,4-benzoquinol methylase